MAVTGLAPPAYYIATSALKSSVVLQAVQGSFQRPGSQDVVFGKVLYSLFNRFPFHLAKSPSPPLVAFWG